MCEKNGDSLSEKVKNPHGANYWHWIVVNSCPIYLVKFWFVQLITRTDGWTCMLCARYAGIGSVRLWPRKGRANYESCKRGDLSFITICVFFLLICMTFKPVVVVTLHIILQIFPYSATYFSNFPPLEAYAYSHRYS